MGARSGRAQSVLAPEIAAQHLVTRVDPLYPPLARSGQVQGTVRLGITITESGSVTDLVYVSGHPLLARAARDAVSQWKYKPFTKDGKPTAVRTTVEVSFSLGAPPAETLGRTLREADVPTNHFDAVELNEGITSFAVNKGDPFLLAYYVDDGSGLLKPPLHVVRYDRQSQVIKRADIRDINALFQGKIPMDCLGSVLSIREYHGVVYIDTHYDPSAGCLVLLTSELDYKTALSGLLIGVIRPDYAIVEGSEIHFMSVHPLHIQVFDLKNKHLVQVYPFDDDSLRSRYSKLIERHISDQWCQQFDAQCDPRNFDVTVEGEVALNEAAKVFGFEAQLDAAGFGEDAQSHVAPVRVAYIFREHDGAWEHRVFEAGELEPLFHVPNIQALVKQKAQAAFETSAQ